MSSAKIFIYRPHNQFTNQITLLCDGKDHCKYRINVAKPVCGNQMKPTTLKIRVMRRIGCCAVDKPISTRSGETKEPRPLSRALRHLLFVGCVDTSVRHIHVSSSNPLRFPCRINNSAGIVVQVIQNCQRTFGKKSHAYYITF